MSTVEVITAALAAGAAAGVQDTASATVRDAYTGLKDLLTLRFHDHEDQEAARALEADEAEPDFWQARIGKALTDTGAAGDEQIIAAASH
jgi:hypothetical protein